MTTASAMKVSRIGSSFNKLYLMCMKNWTFRAISHMIIVIKIFYGLTTSRSFMLTDCCFLNKYMRKNNLLSIVSNQVLHWKAGTATLLRWCHASIQPLGSSPGTEDRISKEHLAHWTVSSHSAAFVELKEILGLQNVLCILWNSMDRFTSTLIRPLSSKLLLMLLFIVCILTFILVIASFAEWYK